MELTFICLAEAVVMSDVVVVSDPKVTDAEMMKFRVSGSQRELTPGGALAGSSASSSSGTTTPSVSSKSNGSDDAGSSNGVSARVASLVNGLSASAAEGLGRKRRRRSLVEQTGRMNDGTQYVNELSTGFPVSVGIDGTPRRRNSVGPAYKGYEDFGDLSFGTSADFDDIGERSNLFESSRVIFNLVLIYFSG